MATINSDDLQSFIDSVQGATSSGSLQRFQELIRQFNLNYANNVAQLYGQNWGPGQVAPLGASTLAASGMFGGMGYIPGYTGGEFGQTMGQVAQGAGIAQAGAGLTGWYAPSAQSQYTPGTFVRLDPSTYDTQQYGDVQMSYVLPSGQMQRVTLPQARSMGWDGNLGTMNVVPATTAIMLERAPPSQLPQQTLQGLTTYSNLNTAAQNQALAQSGVTGMYQQPATVQPPGTNWAGGRFQDLDQGTQQAYYMSNGSDWNAAMTKWVHDSNQAIQQAYANAGGQGSAQPGAGAPQETMQAQQQYFAQAAALAGQFGQYYQPGMPGQAGVAGTNVPQVGQQTLQANEQYYRQALDAINAAAAQQANPFRQAEMLGQLGPLLAGRGVAGFQSPGAATGQTDFSGMGNMQRMIDDIRGGPGSVNSQSVQGVFDAIPTPNKVNSTEFLRSSPQTQNLLLSGIRQKYGIEAQDALQQIKNTLPAFTAPSTFGSVRG